MATIRQYVRRLKRGSAGHRFLGLYEFRKADPPAPAVRLGLWLVAIVLIGGGLAIGWLPGPAVSSPSSASPSWRWSFASWQ